MSRIFITGSAGGLGQRAANLLVQSGHRVVLHARDDKRAKDALEGAPGAESVVLGDLSSLNGMKSVARQVNALGRFDAIIYNASVGYREPRRIETVDGLPHVFAINSLAPYVLTCLIRKPERLIYMSSGLHKDGDSSLNDLLWAERPWAGYAAYSDSKLHMVLLAFAVARRWPDAYSNAVDPGWVATMMGGKGAPDSLKEAPKTQVWLAAGTDPSATVSGRYFYHGRPRAHHPATDDVQTQERLLAACERYSGIAFPK